MNIDVLTTFVTVVLGVSLASERLVTMLKSLMPSLLADEKKTPAQEVDLIADKWRRVVLQVLAFVASWATAAFLADKGADPARIPAWGWQLFHGDVSVGPALSPLHVPVPVMGLLASGGSAFWNNILGYSKAAKDTKQVQKASSTLAYHVQATDNGVVAVDSGQAAVSRATGRGVAESEKLTTHLASRGQPGFGAAPTTNLRPQPQRER